MLMRSYPHSSSSFSFGVAVAALATILGGGQSASASDLAAPSGLPIPPPLAAMHSFRGTVEYVASQDGTQRPVIHGVLLVTDRGWRLDELADTFELRADAGSAQMVSGGRSLQVDDVLDSDALGDAWVVALGNVVTHAPVPAINGRAWTAGDLTYFVDAVGDRVSGIRDERADLSFTFGAWSSEYGLEVPGRILRLRGAIPEASFTVSGYRITPALALAKPSRVLKPYAISLVGRAGDPTRIPSVEPPDESTGQWFLGTLFCFLLGALVVVAWTRRDGIVAELCRRIAADPRGWRRAGTSVFVDADGILFFEGARYRVGPHYFGRAALVQKSALFLRISAPAVPRAIVLARKFRSIDLGIRTHHAGRASGFTLVETLLATALFAAVVLLAVYPAMAAIARASALAAVREQAAVIASDALSDEEAVNDYDGGAPQGTATSIVDGLTLTLTVSPGTIRGESDLDIQVDSADGSLLAHVTSWLGIPVQSPPNSNGGPPPGLRVRP